MTLKLSPQMGRKWSAIALRQLAGRVVKPKSPADKILILDDAGEIVIDASRRGLLVDDELAALVSWYDGTGEHPQGAPKTLARCPMNVFFGVVGNSRLTIQNTPEGPRAVGKTHGGILPRVFATLFPGRTLDELNLNTGDHGERAMLVLADLIEAEPAPAEQLPAPVAPPKQKTKRRGRPTLTPTEARSRNELLNKYRVRKGLSQKEFCDAQGISTTELKKLLAWATNRKERAGNKIVSRAKQFVI